VLTNGWRCIMRQCDDSRARMTYQNAAFALALLRRKCGKNAMQTATEMRPYCATLIVTRD
jgi:hypothetical protein